MQRPVSRNSEGEGEENPLGGLEATVSCLWVLTPWSATVSLVLVAVGMATNQWLHTTEKMSNPHYNGTERWSIWPRSPCLDCGCSASQIVSTFILFF
nr:unnamed protein product [Callosobruchus chinensis]